MIYRVVLDDLYDLHTSDINCMLLNPSLELEMNSAGSFKFTLPPFHPYWNHIEILKSTIDVYEDDDLIFTGRVANIDKNWNNEREVECEGALAYFNDSIHRQMKWETPLPIASEDPNVHNFLKDILDNHNVFVGDATNRQIHVGHIYVDPYLVTREVDYDTTLDILTRMCIDTNGGYFMIRKDPETHLLYLDWLKDFTEESGQPASFGVNLLDFNTGLHAADICTGVLARGATVNDQVVTLSNVELVNETNYPDLSVDHYTDHDQDILWHRAGMAKFGRVVQVHEFPDAQTDWKNDGQIVDNSLFEEARKWLEEKNTKVESIEVEVAELSWLQEGVPKYKLGQIVEILDDAHMAGESYEVRRLPMYKLSCDLSSGSKRVTLGRPPKKELTQISASNSDSSTLSSGNSSGSSSGGGSGSGEECKVHDVRVDGTSVVSNKIANISLAGKADVSTVNALAATVANKADTSTVNILANVVSGKQDQIEFNTLEAATETLTRLKADGVVYNLGGGTEVEANPSESATDDLETIKIGDTVYDIPGGGGSTTNYGKFTYDLLLENNPLPSYQNANNGVNRTYTLSKSIDNYDAVYVIACTDYNSRQILEGCTDRLILKNNYYDSSHVLSGSYTDGRLMYVTFTDDTIVSTAAWGNSGYCPVLYKVYGVRFENKLINRSDIYSEEERIIGRWTDGKPLYQKVVKGTFNGAYTVDTTISYDDISDNIEHIIKQEGYARYEYDNIPASSSWFKASHTVSGNINFLVVDGPGNRVLELQLNNPSWAKMYDYYVVIQYTKTTDTPGSGFLPEDPQFVMMSDYYSEDEQVVGRWTDGKPLYQKTYRNIQLTNSVNITVDSNYSNKNVINFECINDGIENNVRYITPIQSLNTYNDYVWPRVADDNLKLIVNGDWRNYTCTLTVQYTKTTDAPGTGPTKGNLIYLPALYSEEEREVGVWTDGKPIYQKTINVGSITAGGDKRVSASLSIDKIIDISGNAHSSNYNQWVKINFPHQNIAAYIVTAVYLESSQEINIHTGTDFTLDECYITLQYTKTTDQPGSGTWTPEGQLAHHYSTSEKVVGTWIDGSTVYERTWDFSSNPIQLRYNDWVNSTIPSSDGIANVIDCICLNPSYLKITGIEAMAGAGGYPVGLNYCCNTTARAVGYLTLQYTKSS